MNHQEKLEKKIITLINGKWRPDLFKQWYELEKQLANKFFVEKPKIEDFCSHACRYDFGRMAVICIKCDKELFNQENNTNENNP